MFIIWSMSYKLHNNLFKFVLINKWTLKVINSYAYTLKKIPYYLIAISLLCTLLSSCTNDDDGIYFNENLEEINKKVSYTEIEMDILTLVNEYRESKGLTALTPLNIISVVADGHTDYMIETGTINHTNFDQRVKAIKEYAGTIFVGENVAYGYNSAQGAVNGWLNSDAHRKIIEISSYTHFGISVKSNSEGRNYFTQIFIKIK